MREKQLARVPAPRAPSVCHDFGFHDLRRSFSTRNALRLPNAVFQKKMRHKSFTSPKRYI